MIKNLLCWSLLALAIISCDESKVEPDPEARGLNYYPLAVGQFRIYDVTDIKYQHNEPTEMHFQMREWVADSFMDQTNTLTYKIIRSIRPDPQSEWEDDSVMVVTKDYNSVILTKDNTKYVKLVFPVEEGKTWVADAFNNHVGPNDEKETYKYTALDQPFAFEGNTFSKTVTVEQGEARGDIILDDRKEVYARDLGRVYRLFKKFTFENCNDCPEKNIEDGHERHEILVEHGTY